MNREERRALEQRLRQWLQGHHGVISGREARDLGASRPVVITKVDTGEWLRVHHGVYRDTAAPTSPWQDLRAATSATGGVASHRSSSWTWEIGDLPERPQVSVEYGRCDQRNYPGITIHHSSDLHLARISYQRGIPVTNPLRTLVDLAAVAAATELDGALDRAIASRLITVDGLVAEMGRLARPGRPGIELLRRHLDERGFTGAPVPSVLEAKTLRLLKGSGLPMPRVQVHAGTQDQYRLDIAWPAIMLAVEVDGYVYHFSPEHKRRDDARRNALADEGWLVRVYSWLDIMRDGPRVAREVVGTYRRLSAAA